MQISTSEILTGYIEDVFDALSDFSAAERAALARGLDVKRLDAMEKPGAGVQWQIDFFARGRDRRAEIEVVKFTRPTVLQYQGNVGGLLFETSVACRVADSNATEVTVTTKLRARSMSARVFVQSMKLARRKVVKKYRQSVRRLLQDVEIRRSAERG